MLAGIFVLLGVALFFNLGLMPLFGDEAIRGTVAFEMIKSDNYVVPTIWGDFYYRKPPLYNWLIAACFEATGSYSEFVLRLPSVIPLLVFIPVIYWVSRKQIGQRSAWLAGFAFVLSGRIITRDSMLGHIDIFFSLTTFLGFYAIYYFWKRDKMYPLFLVSYLLTAMGVLMKGLPSFLFQGFTLFIWFVYNRQFKRLFSLAHFSGIALLVVIIGGYFGIYSQYNSLEDYFFQLYDQSAQRTVVDNKWYDSLVNIVTFPLENFGHLFPTSLFLSPLFFRGVRKRIMNNSFMAFTLLTLAINIIPYWLSPGYYPRYLFMLYPLIFILGADAFVNHFTVWPKLKNGILWFFFACGVIVALSAFIVPQLAQFEAFESLSVQGLLIGIMTLALLIWWINAPNLRLWLGLSFIVCFRLMFDAAVLPYRLAESDDRRIQHKKDCDEILQIAEGRTLRILGNTPLYEDFAYYLGTGKDEIMSRHDEAQPGVLYVAHPRTLTKIKYRELHRFDLRWNNYEILIIELDED